MTIKKILVYLGGVIILIPIIGLLLTSKVINIDSLRTYECHGFNCGYPASLSQDIGTLVFTYGAAIFVAYLILVIIYKIIRAVYRKKPISSNPEIPLQ